MVITNKLKSKIIESGYTQAKLSKDMCITECAFSRKINNKRAFKIEEVMQIMILLNIQNIFEYFYV